MGKCKNPSERNKRQRKKGLKNPTILWIVSFVLTFILTIVPSQLINAIVSGNPSTLRTWGPWIKVIVDNLYPMIITQSVVTMLQNFSIAIPPKEDLKTPQYVVCTGWTIGLIVSLILYIIVYPLVVYANPPFRNFVLYIISGFLAAIGLGSILQIDHEQERIRVAKEAKSAENQLQRAQNIECANRNLVWSGSLPVLPGTSPCSAETGEEHCSRDNEFILK